MGDGRLASSFKLLLKRSLAVKFFWAKIEMEKWVSINYGVENKREKWKTEGLILRSTCWMEMGDDQLVTCECISL